VVFVIRIIFSDTQLVVHHAYLTSLLTMTLEVLKALVIILLISYKTSNKTILKSKKFNLHQDLSLNCHYY
jgi:hypothetical protein